MPVPLPQSDPVLIREHVYRDTGALDAVLRRDTLANFKPTSEAGLGTFTYHLVDMGSIFEPSAPSSGDTTHHTPVHALWDRTGALVKGYLDTNTDTDTAILAFIAGLLLYALYTFFTPATAAGAAKRHIFNPHGVSSSSKRLYMDIEADAGMTPVRNFGYHDHDPDLDLSLKLNSRIKLSSLFNKNSNGEDTGAGGAIDLSPTVVSDGFVSSGPTTPAGIDYSKLTILRSDLDMETDLLKNRLRID